MQQGNGLAVASLVLGIMSFVVFCIPVVTWFSIPCAILAIIFGIVGRSKARTGAPHGGMATGGLILGLLCLALRVLVILLAVACGVALLSAVGGPEGLHQLMEEAAESGAAP
jgi:hypothetical protein